MCHKKCAGTSAQIPSLAFKVSHLIVIIKLAWRVLSYWVTLRLTAPNGHWSPVSALNAEGAEAALHQMDTGVQWLHWTLKELNSTSLAAESRWVGWWERHGTTWPYNCGQNKIPPLNRRLTSPESVRITLDLNSMHSFCAFYEHTLSQLSFQQFCCWKFKNSPLLRAGRHWVRGPGDGLRSCSQPGFVHKW